MNESSMRSRYSRLPESVANQDGIFEPSTWRNRVYVHVAVQRSRDRCAGAPWLRDKEGTPPRCISTVWNVTTPLRSASCLETMSTPGSQSSARITQVRSGKRMAQEAKAACRKARGSHNPADRTTQVERPILKRS